MTGIRCQLARVSIGLLCILFFVIVILSKTVFLNGYEEIEKQQMLNDLQRGSDAITYRLQALDRTALDWSAWDDSYQFVVDRNRRYIDSNLPDKAMAGIDVHFVLFLDPDNRQVFGKWISLESQKEISFPKGLSAALLPLVQLMKNRPIGEGVRGIVMLPDGPLLVAERPITNAMAITDALTGIPNRRFLLERGEQELERLKRSRKLKADGLTLGCIMLDIDYFKSINDTYGHQGGDAVLLELARRLQTSVRPYDIIGRYGGEEFAVFLTDATGDQTMMVAERIWLSIRSARFYFGSISFPVTASLGLSCCMDDDEQLDAIIRRADAALYNAKSEGRDRIKSAS